MNWRRIQWCGRLQERNTAINPRRLREPRDARMSVWETCSQVISTTAKCAGRSAAYSSVSRVSLKFRKADLPFVLGFSYRPGKGLS